MREGDGMIGSFGSVVFQTSDRKILTPRGIQQTTGSSWALHDIFGGKQKAEYTGQVLRTFSFDITLSAELGVRPRKTLEQLEKMAESREAYLLVIGGRPIGENPWRLVSLSETWDTVLNRGELVSAKASLNLEEYV